MAKELLASLRQPSFDILEHVLPGCSRSERVDCAEGQLHFPPGGGDSVAVVDDCDGLDKDGGHLQVGRSTFYIVGWLQIRSNYRRWRQPSHRQRAILPVQVSLV